MNPSYCEICHELHCRHCHTTHAGLHLPPDEFALVEPSGRRIFVGTKRQCEERRRYIATKYGDRGEPPEPIYAARLSIAR